MISIKNEILNGRFDKIFNVLYSDVTLSRERYANAVDCFEKLYGQREVQDCSACR